MMENRTIAVPESIGWTSGPPDFGDPLAEDRTARADAALFDLTGRTHLVLTGTDRARFLHGFCTNEVKKLAAGEGREAFVTNIKGRIVEHVFAFATENAILIDATAGREESLFAHLDKYLLREDVRIERRTAETGSLFVTGPQAEPKLLSAGIDAHRLESCAHRAIDPAVASGGRIARVDLLNQPGFVLFAPREVLPALRAALTSAGVRPAGSTVFEPLRIEAGLPLHGVDLTDENLAQGAMRTGRAISFTKGCYLGQEPIARLDALGHVNRQLAGLKIEAGPVPPPGSKVTTSDGKEVGAITSSAQAPTSAQPVALAILRSQVCRADVPLRVHSGDRSAAATWFGW